MFGRFSGRLSKHQMELFDKLNEITKIPKTELFGRAFDFYLYHMRAEFEKAGIKVPKEIAEANVNSLITLLPDLRETAGRGRKNGRR